MSDENGESWSSKSRSFRELVELGGDRGSEDSSEGGGGSDVAISFALDGTGMSVGAWVTVTGCGGMRTATGCVAWRVLTRFSSGGLDGTSTGLARFRTMTGLLRGNSDG